MAEVKPRIRLDKKDVKKGDTVDVKTLVSTSWRPVCAKTQAASSSRA